MSANANQRGLTLIELLVTMVILGFVITTLSGALSQISQMLRISSEQTHGFLGRWTQSRAIFDIVANMALDPTLDEPFKGAPERMELVSLSSPDAPVGEPRRLLLVLEPGQDRTEPVTRIKLTDLDAIPPVSNAQLLTAFKGRLEFRYLDKQQREHSQWPVSNAQQTQKLPSAVVLRDTGRQQILVRMAAYPGQVNPPNSIGQALLGGK